MFLPLTQRERQLHAAVVASQVDGVPGVVQYGDPQAANQFAVSYGTHLKEARVVGNLLDWLDKTKGELNPDVSLLLVCSFPKGVNLAYESDDRDVWKQYRAYPGGPDGNRMPKNDEFYGTGNYVLDRIGQIRDLFLRRKVRNLLDIHATDGPSSPGYLGCAGPHAAHAKIVPYVSAGLIYTEVDVVQANQGTMTRPFSAASGTLVGSEIEVGQTGTQQALDNCLVLAKAWGRAVGAIRGALEKYQGEQKIYRMVASYMAPNGDFEVADPRYLDDLAPVSSGEVLLINRGNGDTVKAVADGFLVWGPSEVKLAPEDLPSEIWYQVQKA